MKDPDKDMGTDKVLYEFDSMSSSHDSVGEDDGQATQITLSVSLNRGAAFDKKVVLAFVTPKEGKRAKHGEDFDATIDTLTIAKGQRVGTVQLILTPKDNATADGDKAFGVQATLPNGRQAQVDIWITDDELADDEVVFSFSGAIEDQAYTAGTAITARHLPEAVGGEGAVTYRVAGLPAGLTFDPATRTLAGTPSSATNGAVEVLYQASDEANNTSSLTFSITVNPPLSFVGLFGAGKMVPTAFALAENVPNPFNPATTIRYALPQAAEVELIVYNVVGQPVRTLVAEHQRPGHYAVEWDAADDSGHSLASGLYFYRLQAGGTFRAVKKMLLLR